MIDAASYEDLDGIKMCTFDLTQQNINALKSPIQQVETIELNRVTQAVRNMAYTQMY